MSKWHLLHNVLKLKKEKVQKHLGVIGFLTAVGLLSACAPQAMPAPTEVLEVQATMREFEVRLSQTAFPVGSLVRFLITNDGALAHNFVIERQGAVDEPLVADGERAKVEEENLPPGASLTFEWTFTEAGNFQIACHVPGHYEAGMVSPIVVQ